MVQDFGNIHILMCPLDQNYGRDRTEDRRTLEMTGEAGGGRASLRGWPCLLPVAVVSGGGGGA